MSLTLTVRAAAGQGAGPPTRSEARQRRAAHACRQAQSHAVHSGGQRACRVRRPPQHSRRPGTGGGSAISSETPALPFERVGVTSEKGAGGGTGLASHLKVSPTATHLGAAACPAQQGSPPVCSQTPSTQVLQQGRGEQAACEGCASAGSTWGSALGTRARCALHAAPRHGSRKELPEGGGGGVGGAKHGHSIVGGNGARLVHPKVRGCAGWRQACACLQAEMERPLRLLKARHGRKLGSYEDPRDPSWGCSAAQLSSAARSAAGWLPR